MPNLLAKQILHKKKICKKLQLKFGIKEYEETINALLLQKVAASYDVSSTIMQFGIAAR